MTSTSARLCMLFCITVFMVQPIRLNADTPATTAGGHIVVVIDQIGEIPARSRHGAGRRERPYQPVISFLQDAYALQHADTRLFPSIGQAWLVFRDNGALNDKQLRMVAEVHPQISDARRSKTHTVRGNESRGAGADPVQPIALAGIAASQRWSSGMGVRIALIGTGADRKHPDFKDRIAMAKDFSGRRMRGFDQDAHGTALASIIAGHRAAGIRGVAPDTDLLILRACLQRQPTHYDADCDSVAIASALQYVLQNQVQMLLLSFSGPEDPLLTPLIEQVISQGIIVTTGWPGSDLEPYPSRIPGLIAARDEAVTDDITTIGPAVRLPDQKVLVALPGKRYGTLRGQTAASALTSGIIALLLQRKPHMASGVIIEQLTRTANEKEGTVDACQALGDAIGAPCNPEMLAELP